MRREDCRLGMKVVFGRKNGEKTTGIVRKLNRVRAKVETLESRGSRSESGAMWTVAYRGLREVNPDGTIVANATANDSLPYDPIMDECDLYILRAIVEVHLALSPETLSCDGEATDMFHIIHRKEMLTKKLNALFTAFGREVSETVAYSWDKARLAAEM